MSIIGGDGVGPSFIEWVVAFCLQTIALVAGGTWRIRSTIVEERKEVDHSMAMLENELRMKIDGVESNARQALESSQRIYAVTVDTIKESLHEHIVYVERNFARRESFDRAVEDMKQEIKDGLDRIHQRLDHRGT